MKKVTSAKMAVNDNWVASAMTDDDMVVELLIRLKHAGTVVAQNPLVNLPPFRWGIRKPRSRSSRFGGGGALVSLKKDLDSVRASPKTPLSWSGGSASASPSTATADGFEDNSRQTSCSTSTGSGSKVFLTNETTSSLSKRLKKKKLSSELKYEEDLKLKERLVLEKEIASLRATFDEQHVRNQRLKRIKLDLNLSHVKKETSSVDNDMIHKSELESKCCRGGDEKKGSLYFLPDLNMLPSEEELIT